MNPGKIQFLLALIIIGSISSCVKDPQDIPPGLTNDPVFNMTASFGNEPVSIGAGKNSWTMLPVVVQSDSLLVYTAVFSQDGCLDQCSPSWTFKFYQALPSINDPVGDFNNTIEVGNKDFVSSDLERDSFEISLATHPGLFMSGFSFWEDLNGPSTTFYHEYQNVVGYQEDINVCFQSLAFTGCQYTQCVYFDPATEVPCLSSIEAILEDPRHVSLNLHLEGTPPFQIQWFNEASTSAIVIPVQDSTSEIYAAVSVTDALGNRSELFQTIRLQNGIVDGCYFPISLTSTPVSNTSSLLLADKVEIIYRDENGVEWRTTAGVQTSANVLNIEHIREYELSPFDQPSYIVELNVNALLFNELTGESKLLVTQYLSIALSHP